MRRNLMVFLLTIYSLVSHASEILEAPDALCSLSWKNSQRKEYVLTLMEAPTQELILHLFT